jgi:hypothetical protein
MTGLMMYARQRPKKKTKLAKNFEGENLMENISIRIMDVSCMITIFQSQINWLINYKPFRIEWKEVKRKSKQKKKK